MTSTEAAGLLVRLRSATALAAHEGSHIGVDWTLVELARFVEALRLGAAALEAQLTDAERGTVADALSATQRQCGDLDCRRRACVKCGVRESALSKVTR